MSQPTPGPWILDDSVREEIAILGAQGYEGIPEGKPGHEDDRRIIAVITAPAGGSETDQDEANSRYMACSWELVEAAERVIERFADYDPTSPEMGELRVIVAKARGEETP